MVEGDKPRVLARSQPAPFQIAELVEAPPQVKVAFQSGEIIEAEQRRVRRGDKGSECRRRNLRNRAQRLNVVCGTRSAHAMADLVIADQDAKRLAPRRVEFLGVHLAEK